VASSFELSLVPAVNGTLDVYEIDNGSAPGKIAVRG
jgi:hypothetical protein